MGFLEDAPKSVMGMVRIMRDFGQYKYDVGDIFRDFVDYGTACFLVHGDKELADRLKEKYKDDYPKLGELFYAWIKIMDERITDTVLWFDALGTLYEYLASRSKKSWLGQFFTPESLCDLMTHITSSSQKQTDQKVNDCACGSGRMLLSFNAVHPGNLLYGEDMDPICAKMTALNLAIHGGQGQVTCMDSLCQDWKFCYEVNPYHKYGSLPVPHLMPVPIEGCVAKLQAISRENEYKMKVDSTANVHDKPVVNKQKVYPGQLTLF